MPGGAKGGSSAPANQTVVQKTELPAWVSQAGQDNVTDAKNIAAHLAPAYTGNTVAGFNQQQADAWAQAGQASGASAGSLNAAQSALMGAANYQPMMVTPHEVVGSTIAAQNIADKQQAVQAQQIAGKQQTVTSPLISGLQQQIAGSTIASKDIGAKTFTAEDLAKYQNPYTQQVVDAGLSDLERQRQLTQVTNGDKAASMGAFGGSRQAIQEGVTNAESARAAGTLSAQLRADAFNTAAGLLNTDNDRTLRADQSNQAASLDASKANQATKLAADTANQATWLGATTADQKSYLAAALANQATNLDATKTDAGNALTADTANQSTRLNATKADQSANLTAAMSNQANALDVSKSNASNWLSADQGNQSTSLAANGQKIAAGSALTNLGQTQFNQAAQQAAVNEGIGDKLQGYDQALLNQDQTQYNAARNYEQEQLNIKLAALSATPYGETKTTTGPAQQQGGSPLLGALGGASTGASIASTLGLTGALGGYGGVAGAGLGGLMGLLAISDKNEKTDIRPAGKDPKTGLKLYSYRYKGDPKSYPKVVGPMAQDVQKKYPGMVKKMPGSGKLAVDAGFLGGVMAGAR